jgi:hypothetical protein
MCATSRVPVGMNVTVSLSSLSKHTLYYWQVRAVNTDGDTLANAGIAWYFTTAATTTIYLPLVKKAP